MTAKPQQPPVRQIPITVVSRAAIERLVASLNWSIPYAG